VSPGFFLKSHWSLACLHVAAGRMGSGFGIGALEDLGEEDEDVYSQGICLILFCF
jgi:hypothetical protein